MSNYTRGRCRPCGVVWHWTRGERPLRGTKCPDCGEQLAQTSQNVKARLRRYRVKA